MPCQYCGSAEHQALVCKQQYVPHVKLRSIAHCTSVHPEKNMTSQDEGYKGYKFNDTSLGYPKVSYEIRGDVGDV